MQNNKFADMVVDMFVVKCIDMFVDIFAYMCVDIFTDMVANVQGQTISSR